MFIIIIIIIIVIIIIACPTDSSIAYCIQFVITLPDSYYRETTDITAF